MLLKSGFAVAALTLCMTVNTAARAESLTIPSVPALEEGEPDVGAAISPMKKQQRAPFTGLLLSPRAIAELVAEVESIDSVVKQAVSTSQKEETAKCEHRVAESVITLGAERDVVQAKLDAQLRVNELLSERLKQEEDSRPNVIWWAGGGAAVGALVVVGTVLLAK